MKRKDSKDSPRTQSIETATSPSTGTPVPSPQKSLSHAIDDNDGEPLVSERAGQSAPDTNAEISDRRVQFDKARTGELAERESDDYDENQDDKKKKAKG